MENLPIKHVSFSTIPLIPPDEGALQALDLLQARFGNHNRHHWIDGDGLNHWFGQRDAPREGQLVNLLSWQLSCNHVNKILEGLPFWCSAKSRHPQIATQGLHLLETRLVQQFPLSANGHMLGEVNNSLLPTYLLARHSTKDFKGPEHTSHINWICCFCISY